MNFDQNKVDQIIEHTRNEIGPITLFEWLEDAEYIIFNTHAGNRLKEAEMLAHYILRILILFQYRLPKDQIFKSSINRLSEYKFFKYVKNIKSMAHKYLKK